MKVIEKYEHKPHQWNLAIMLTIGSLLWSALAFYINAGVNIHSISNTAHPQMVQQLNRMEANQIDDKIEKMYQRICSDQDNNFYRSELRKLITEWESLTGKKYPTELLGCVNGNP